MPSWGFNYLIIMKDARKNYYRSSLIIRKIKWKKLEVIPGFSLCYQFNNLWHITAHELILLKSTFPLGRMNATLTQMLY